MMAPVRDRIPRAIVLSFAGLIAAGTLFLSLPGCAVEGRLTLLQALFTAASAVCVTGLTVIDPGRDLSPFGQGVLALLIQLGGLGILSLSGFVILSLGRREELGQRMYVETAHGGVRGVSPLAILKNAVLVSAAIEAIGAALLYAGFGLALGSYGLRTAWLAVFHAISAFCNAGFSLFPSNLNAFRDDPIVCLTVMGLIVVGGIGFVVIADLSRLRRMPAGQRRFWRLSLHSRMVLATTATLVLGGAVLTAAIEWNNSLRDAPWTGRVLGPLFYSVTCRTAGFDSIRTASLTSATLALGIVLMFIGASPGGTGGGIKTTSAATIWAMLASRARGRPAAEIFGRTIPPETVSKAIATAGAFVAVLVLANLGLSLTEVGLVPHERGPGLHLDFAFETVSAIGTVGLSTGITPALSPGGKLILIALMFVGRTGPLVIGASLIGRRRDEQSRLPEEDVIVG